VTPLGCGSMDVWNRLVAPDSGVVPFQCDLPDIPVSVCARVRGFDREALFGKQAHKYKSLSTHYALHAGDIALECAQFNEGKDIDLTRAGVAIASGMGTLKDITDTNSLSDESYRRLSPFFVSKILINMAAGETSIRHKLRGPNHAVATACAAGAHAIGDAYNFIRMGYADFMVAGGTEAPLDPLSVAGFSRMKALTRNTDPLTASRPFDSSRDGFVIGEGSGILVLESLESAQRRGAQILAEVTGYGMSGDAHHITSPATSGEGAARAMMTALWDAGLQPEDVGYINAHATSTPAGDLAETDAIHNVFGQDQITDNNRKGRTFPLYVSSTKGATGHMLGAAGAVEAAFAVMALRTGTLPPTLNLSVSTDETSESTVRESFQHIPGVPVKADVSHVMSNSFGFGGTNASLIFSKYCP